MQGNQLKSMCALLDELVFDVELRIMKRCWSIQTVNRAQKRATYLANAQVRLESFEYANTQIKAVLVRASGANI